MAKLYIFGIGGTGSRVLKALTMLFASGVTLPEPYKTVVPVIIDPDTGNGDLNRTKEILQLYQTIQRKSTSSKHFFRQEMKSLFELADGVKDGVINPQQFLFHLNNTAGTKFRDYIDYGTMSDENKLFVRSLFSESNLKSDLDVGFKGNPNMGSIVLNQFTNSDTFQQFGSTFGSKDSVFIINSIFGGTGAAGFPLLLKSLRSGNANIPNAGMVQQANIGGITYLPYFNLNQSDSSSINSDTFLEKAKVALEYYNRTIINTGQIDNLYFIGNIDDSTVYENHEGSTHQKNKANFLEMAGALAIIDFCKVPDGHGSNTPSVVKEFGVKNNNTKLTFNDLDSHSANLIRPKLLQYNLFSEYLDQGLEKALNVSRWTVRKTLLTNNFFKSPDFQGVMKGFNGFFKEWLNEMASNSPAFVPFNSVRPETALTIDKQNEPKGDVSFKPLDIANCKIINKTDYSSGKLNQLIELFGKSTEHVLFSKKIVESDKTN